MDDLKPWVRWHDERPKDGSALYRWRVPEMKILGMMLRPEWTAPLRLCGMGHSDREYWPLFSHWNGYRRTLPKGTEWRLAANDEGENNIYWGGLELDNCPFTGKVPYVGYHGQYIGAPPYRPEWLHLTSHLVDKTGFRSALKMQQLWNTRPTPKAKGAQ